MFHSVRMFWQRVAEDAAKDPLAALKPKPEVKEKKTNKQKKLQGPLSELNKKKQKNQSK